MTPKEFGINDSSLGSIHFECERQGEWISGNSIYIKLTMALHNHSILKVNLPNLVVIKTW